MMLSKAVFFLVFGSLAMLHGALTASFMLGVGNNGLISAGTLGRSSSANSCRVKLHIKASKSSSSYFPPQKESGRRKKRRLREAQVRARFLNGEDLDKLRANIDTMKEKLQYLKSSYSYVGKSIDTDDLAMALRDAIERSEKRDPDMEYIKALAALECATREYRKEDIDQIKDEAMMTRQCIPRLNLQGLWIGESASSDPQMINVTYVGDSLIASSIAGSGNVPKGDIFLKADLSYVNALQPIRVSGTVAEKWGKKKLTLYPGKAQSSRNSDPNWVNGHFFMCNDEMFGFLFLATKQHILFRRPKVKQIFKMIQDGIVKEKEMEQLSSYLERCYNLTYTPSQQDVCSITFRQLKRWNDEIA